MAEDEQPTMTENEAKMKASSVSAAQVAKLRDANLKYKNLLKMAKERIQQQENELEFHRGTLDAEAIAHLNTIHSNDLKEVVPENT